jgi:hypothetical protein
MIQMKALLLEGRYDSLSRQLSRKLISVVKDSFAATNDIGGKYLDHKVYYTANETVPDINSNEAPDVYSEEIENTTIPLEFYLTLKLQWVDGFNNVYCDGNAYNDSTIDADEPPLVEVLLKLDPAMYPNVLSEVVSELADTIRHEIEHLTQSGWNTKSSKFISSDQRVRNKISTGEIPAYRYYTLPKEIPAMIQGLYNKAKQSRQPFADVVNNHLQSIINKGWITPDESETIKATWRKYLPKLAIRQEL